MRYRTRVSDTEEHSALLNDGSAFEELHRKEGLFEEGVTTLFGIRGGEAELHAFHLCPCRFTPDEALDWLAERGLVAEFFVEAAGPSGD
jgi:hypothetical protein